MSVINRDGAIYGLLMRLRQVGRLQIGRILGTVSNENGAYKAFIDLLERSYFMRAELNALTKVLLDKGILTQADWQRRIEAELRQYVSELAAHWPEIELRDDGFTVKDLPAFTAWMRREGWPP